MVIESEFHSLSDLVGYFESESKCRSYLAQIRWGNTITCIHCDHDSCYILKGQNQRYKCAKCRKQFSIKKGTQFEGSNISLQKWFMAIFLINSLKENCSSTFLGKNLGVTQKTAWYMLKRISNALFLNGIDHVHREELSFFLALRKVSKRRY